MCFLYLFNNKCIIIFSLKNPLYKSGDFIDKHCNIFSFFFCLAMFHESQKWGLMTIQKVIYFIYIDFIQYSSSNRWIKITFDSKWIWVPQCYHQNFKVFSLMFRIGKGCHQDFSLLCTIILVIHHFFGWKVVHPSWVFTYKSTICKSHGGNSYIRINWTWCWMKTRGECTYFFDVTFKRCQWIF